jgi:hypothetical protein
MAFWEQEFGYHVVSPFGWLRRGIPLDAPLTADAFVLMSNDSGIAVDNLPRALATGAIELPDQEKKKK